MADVDARKVCGVPERTQLHVAMLALQFGYAGFHVVSRAALNMGISKVVFPVYRNIIALILLVPRIRHLTMVFAVQEGQAGYDALLRRPVLPPRFVWVRSICHVYIDSSCFAAILNSPCCFHGSITANQGFYLLGLEYTSPTFASAIQNSVPAITFLMAAVLRQDPVTVTDLTHSIYDGREVLMNRIEKVRIDRRDGIAKLMGTLACVGGATVITLYKGPTIFGPSRALNGAGQLTAPTIGKDWTLGCLYLIGHCLSWSGWLVLQAPVLKKYPARLSVTSYTCFFGVIQFLVIAAFIERDSEAWMFHSGGELFTILYAVGCSLPILFGSFQVLINARMHACMRSVMLEATTAPSVHPVGSM
ncbi:hypothetical protein BHE74_00003994 [Ensete ventricosum]|nr:hypothetical protein BHE74_00003994 [Ensete ventricosum]